MKLQLTHIVIIFYLEIVRFRVAHSSQYLVKCNGEKTKCLNDISSKGFIAKETNVPGFYSAEDPNSLLNTTDDTLTNVPGFSIAEDPNSSLNVTDDTLNNMPGFSSTEDTNSALNITDDKLENRNLVQETRGYRYPEKSKFSKIASKSEAKLKAIEGVELIEEQIYEKRVKKTWDANWNDMWAVNGAVVPSMKVIEAWNLGYSGRGIYIAIVDDGVDISHRDLIVNTGRKETENKNSRRYFSKIMWYASERSDYHYDYIVNVQDPSPASGDTHGTNCAGLIGAEKDNSECIAGIAYKANLVGIRLLGSQTTDMMEGNSLSHKISKIDIYSNSWGPEDRHGFQTMRTHTSASVENGIRTGRNGKGTIYVWAAGNGGQQDNCNADGLVNSIYTISISSINSYQESATYAEVCAPVLATTYGGGGGSNKYLYSTSPQNSCTGRHSGTSFSAPQAAAIIALALEANADLTWRDVQHIIVRTSKRHNLRDGAYNWQINGANRDVHPVLGFGLMDAEAMVKTANSWRSVCDASTYTTLTRNPYSYIPTQNVYTGVTDQITVQDSDSSIRYLEHVVVWVYFESNSNGDTELYLTSPSGTKSYLLTPRPLEVGHSLYVRWHYMTVQHWGESPLGIWSLRMLVSSYRYAGTLYSWKITFYGTSQEPFYGNRSGTSDFGNNESAPNLVGIIAGSVCGGIVMIVIIVVCIKVLACSNSRVAPKPQQVSSQPTQTTSHQPSHSRQSPYNGNMTYLQRVTTVGHLMK